MPAKYDLTRIDPAFLAWVKVRCDIDPEPGGCWIWRNGLKDGAQPQGKYKGQTLNVRRELLRQIGGDMQHGRIAQCSCKQHGCTNPEHLYSASRSAALKGRTFTQAHRANIAAAARRRSTLDDETVAAIRASDEGNQEIADRLGIDDSTVSAIRRLKTWKDYASPFAGLFTGLCANESTTRRAA